MYEITIVSFNSRRDDFLVWESNFCISVCIPAMGSHILIMHSWMLVEKAGKTPLKRKITAYWKQFVCYIWSPNIFCSISELLYFSICWNDGFHTFCFVKWEELKENSPTLMIKIPSVEALHYSTFQNRKDELLLQWHRSNLKLESIALPTLNTKDVHCLQTEFFLVCAEPMIRFFFFL